VDRAQAGCEALSALGEAHQAKDTAAICSALGPALTVPPAAAQT
jgi:hypothetical protein